MPTLLEPSLNSPPRARLAKDAEVADLAARSVLTEVLVTPKPGLVDRRNSGAHDDMDIGTFFASAAAIEPWWRQFVEQGRDTAHLSPCSVLPRLRATGVPCEQAMFAATGGVNTHKGAIFALGLLCGSGGRLLAHGVPLTPARLCAGVSAMCSGLVERELRRPDAPRTAGGRAFARYGFSGARGEAASGFALVRLHALPSYRQLQRDGVGDEIALPQVLLGLLAVNADTNLVSRGGLCGLDYVRGYARRLLREGGALGAGGRDRMAAFDDALIARGLSPGGSADLLAVTWFLGQLPKPWRRRAGVWHRCLRSRHSRDGGGVSAGDRGSMRLPGRGGPRCQRTSP